jgi:hypothetical protein
MTVLRATFFRLVAVAASVGVFICDLSAWTPDAGKSSQDANSMEVTIFGVAASARRGSGWKAAIATVFWVGEEATADNGFIPNVRNAWDVEWQTHYGGVDDPNVRCGYRPCSFVPRENPFYIALPYDDMHDNGTRKSKTSIIPWDRPGATKSLLKNRWVAVRANDKTCYAQWEDVGPFETDDAAYVFGDVAKPKNKRGEAIASVWVGSRR